MKSVLRRMLKLLCRIYPIERGKFKILNEIYFKYVAPRSSHWIDANLSYGINMRLDISEFLQAHLYLFGSYELPTVRFIRKLLSNGGIAFDVGAQIGYLSLAMATSGNRNAIVYSFEPEPENIKRYEENLKLNKITNMTLVSKAVSDRSGTLKLYLSKDHNSGTHSTIPDDPNVTDKFVEVEAVTLDSFVSTTGIKSLDLIKIDVEGGELEVVNGCITTLKSLKPTLIIELAESIQNSRHFSTPAFKIMMSDFRYTPYIILDSGLLMEVSMTHTHLMDNVVFIHNDKKAQLSSLLYSA